MRELALKDLREDFLTTQEDHSSLAAVAVARVVLEILELAALWAARVAEVLPTQLLVLQFLMLVEAAALELTAEARVALEVAVLEEILVREVLKLRERQILVEAAGHQVHPPLAVQAM
jgi:hypothetical protein